MKKLISLLLVIVITCSLLSGCGFEIGKTEQSTTTSTTVTTTDLGDDPIQNPPVDELVFEHGDNFTEEDVEFVRSLIGSNPLSSYEYMKQKTHDFLSCIEAGLSYTSIKIDKSNTRYICAYIDLDQPQNAAEYIRGYLRIHKFTWYKFSDVNDIPDTIDGLERCFSYALNNCVAERFGNEEYSYVDSCIYYTLFDDISKLDFSNVVITLDKILAKDGDSCIFIKNKIYGGWHLQAYVDNAEKLYIVVSDEICNIETGESYNFSKEELGKYYDILVPYFEYFDYLDDYYTDSNGESFVQRKLYLEMSIIIDILAEE